MEGIIRSDAQLAGKLGATTNILTVQITGSEQCRMLRGRFNT